MGTRRNYQAQRRGKIWLITSDMLVNRSILTARGRPRQLGRKSIAVNLSDLRREPDLASSPFHWHSFDIRNDGSWTFMTA
jgi:hypothetical protein